MIAAGKEEEQAGSMRAAAVRHPISFARPCLAHISADLAEIKTFQRTPLTRRISYFWAVVTSCASGFAVTKQKIFKYRVDDNPPRAARTTAVYWQNTA